MLRLPPFALLRPVSVEEALAMLAEAGDARLLAGGTDLLPNLKHGLYAPRRLISLRRIEALSTLREESGAVVVGAGVKLADLANHPTLSTRYPALARAASLVAGPQLRRMGTIGGNVCLDTRCVYFNQTRFWRGALGCCLKKDGERCHVVPTGSRCVAAFSADTPGPLMLYDAELTLRSIRGERRVAIADFFVADGLRNTILAPDEILTEIRLPAPPPGSRSAYQKLRRRRSIDFPALSVALGARVEMGVVKALRLIVGALQARPRAIPQLDALCGGALDEALAEAAGRLAQRCCHPLSNIAVDSDWRRAVLPVIVRRAFSDLAESA